MPIRYIALALPLVATLAACSSDGTRQAAVKPQPAATGDRPMDEVPVQKTLPNGDRSYGYSNGCVVVLEAKRAVVKTEGASCQPHHRDISLLYASGD